jgi:hypothetical protein
VSERLGQPIHEEVAAILRAAAGGLGALASAHLERAHEQVVALVRAEVATSLATLAEFEREIARLRAKLEDVDERDDADEDARWW